MIHITYNCIIVYKYILKIINSSVKCPYILKSYCIVYIIVYNS